MQVVVDPNLTLRAGGQMATSLFHEESPFFRTTRLGVLPRIQRQRLTKSLLDVLRRTGSHRRCAPLRAGTFRLQEAGVAWTFAAFADIIVAANRPDSAQLSQLLETYARRVIVRANVRGHYRNFERDAAEARMGLAARLRDVSSATTQPTDIIGVVLSCNHESWTDDDRAELVLLLCLSVVGFTGVALEWVLADFGRFDSRMSSSGALSSQHYVLESLRLHPPAWKVTREMLDNGAGTDSVLFSVDAMHRHHGEWDLPDQYVPDRWRREELKSSTAFMPFGFGVARCPAHSFATTYLVNSVDTLRENFRISVSGLRLGVPYVGILHAPPRSSLLRLSAR